MFLSGYKYSVTVVTLFYRYLRKNLSINRTYQLYRQKHEPEPNVWQRQ